MPKMNWEAVEERTSLLEKMQTLQAQLDQAIAACKAALEYPQYREIKAQLQAAIAACEPDGQAGGQEVVEYDEEKEDSDYTSWDDDPGFW